MASLWRRKFPRGNKRFNCPLPCNFSHPVLQAGGVCGGSGADGSSSSFKTNLSFRFHTGVWSGGKTKPGSDPLFLRIGSDLEGGTFVFSLSSDPTPGSDLEERHDQVQFSVI